MTAQSLLTTLLPLVADLSRELSEGERYRRLLHAMARPAAVRRRGVVAPGW
ncbi:anaerobic nitric oxide reductase transcription regulator [Pseudomonas fluorescens]|uniref:Anaerobic nitric oxide reductase transcription regulator n=1 Tax=Pseudomonas fluorescens TaxID=294 RepID=A0A8B4IFT0_PSEFL|nr:anaerobic nitric oxide reductase transcription regulator [Pseudomonas fluorescens]